MSTSGRVKGSKKLSVKLALDKIENSKAVDSVLDGMFDTIGFMGAGASLGIPPEDVCPGKCDDPWCENHYAYEPTREDELAAILTVADHGLKIGAHLAGGCLRDYILGKHENLKDYDLFFHGADISALETLPGDIFGNAKILPPEAVKNMREEVKGLVKYHSASIDIVIVDCESIRDTVKTFDASVCQVWVENVGCGEVGVFCTHEFLEFMHKKVWYWFKDVPTSAHLDRVVAKYGPYIEKEKSDMKVHFLGLLKNL